MLKTLDSIHTEIKITTWALYLVVPVMVTLGTILGFTFYWLSVGNFNPDPDLAFSALMGLFLGACAGGGLIGEISSRLDTLKREQRHLMDVPRM